jgi:hypothetical protein
VKKWAVFSRECSALEEPGSAVAGTVGLTQSSASSVQDARAARIMAIHTSASQDSLQTVRKPSANENSLER